MKVRAVYRTYPIQTCSLCKVIIYLFTYESQVLFDTILQHFIHQLGTFWNLRRQQRPCHTLFFRICFTDVLKVGIIAIYSFYYVFNLLKHNCPPYNFLTNLICQQYGLKIVLSYSSDPNTIITMKFLYSTKTTSKIIYV